jgi:pilus assembly protein CpaE
VLDYIVKPLTPNLVQRALSLALDGQRSAGRGTRPGKMILVEGVRGGVGATMVATGVAWSLAHTRRRRTVLLDFDFTFGSVALALDLDPSRELRHALENPGRLDGLYVERLLTRVSDTLCVLSAEENPEEPLDVDPAALELLLDELRAKFHYVVVDLPRSSSRTHQQLAGGPATAILVTDLSLAGMRDTLRMIESVKAGNEAAQIIVVANRIGEHRQGEISPAEFEKAIGRGVDIRIPFDSRSVAAAMNAGKPVCARPGEVARALEALAEKASGAAQRPSRNPLRRLAALWTRS